MHQKPCTLGDGATFSVLSLLCFFAAGVLVCCTPKPEPMSTRNYGDVKGGKRQPSRVETQTAELQMENNTERSSGTGGKFDPEWV